MPIEPKSAADQVAEAKANAAGIPYVKRTWDNLGDDKVENAPNKPTEPVPKRELSPGDDELTGQPEATPKASSVVSDKKKEANKANAQNATGPRTEAGKARVSENALKHGLRSAKNPLDISTQIPGEQTQLADLVEDFDAAHQPADPAELQLVIRLAQLTLRLNRAAQMETATLDQARVDTLASAQRFPEQYPDPGSQAFETQILATTYYRADKQLALLSQYESRLSHDFARTLRQLLQVQKLRKQSQSTLKTQAARDLAPTQANAGQIANLSEEPQHLGADLTVSTTPETPSCLDSPVYAPTNHQPSNEPRSPLTNSDRTKPTPPLHIPVSAPYLQDSGTNQAVSDVR